jgi:hypothetical protein
MCRRSRENGLSQVRFASAIVIRQNCKESCARRFVGAFWGYSRGAGRRWRRSSPQLRTTTATWLSSSPRGSSTGAARIAAEEEVAFTQSLCTHPISSLIAVHRVASEGDVRESFRRLQLREGQRHGNAFSFMEVEDNDEPTDLSLVDLHQDTQRR